MRVASRIIGSVLALCGLGLFCIFGYVSVKEGWPTGRRVWPLGAFFILGGLGLMLAGRYYLRLDPDTLDPVRPVSILGRFMIVHRSQLRVLAQAGAVISLIYFGMACFGQEWPGRWFLWPLVLGAIALQSIARKIANPTAGKALGWSRVPRWMRAILEPTKKTGGGSHPGCDVADLVESILRPFVEGHQCLSLRILDRCHRIRSDSLCSRSSLLCLRRGSTRQRRQLSRLLLRKPGGLPGHDLPAVGTRPLQQDPQDVEVVVMHGARGAVSKLVQASDQSDIAINPDGTVVECH